MGGEKVGVEDRGVYDLRDGDFGEDREGDGRVIEVVVEEHEPACYLSAPI